MVVVGNRPSAKLNEADFTRITVRLYASHLLSTWNSRMFEFAAFLFLAGVFPGTLLFASIYALARSFAVFLLSSLIGRLMDRSNRLLTIRHSIDLNASMRRIDLVAKLVAPLFISLVDAASTYAALWVVLGSSLASVTVEYFAIAQVYHAVPELARPSETTELSDHILEPADPRDASTPNQKPSLEHISVYINGSLSPWCSYFRSPVLLASLSLCILYLTVLSFNAQMITYLLASGFTATWVSVFRLISVVVELAATWAAPMLMSQIGPTRSGLWFITWQSVCAAVGVALFSTAALELRMRSIALISGVIMSRIGLWGFDLSVQFLVQEEVASVSRSQFSATEAALQNLFEMLSFATTSIFAKPEQFQYPALISVGATMVANLCFTTYVRQIRGHLFHKSRCLARQKYTRVDDSDVELTTR
ncbi:MAG: hypothetical protein Q9171_006592 [Xanthocarpia ochracea]